MIIVNADDWGRSVAETDAAADCHRAGRITSVTAMVFMDDSARAAAIARDSGIPVGLHLNLSQPFAQPPADPRVSEAHERVRRFLARHRYAASLFHPGRVEDFRLVYRAQWEEFVRLYGHAPSHVDGHHHKHLCMNMLLGNLFEPGAKVRRNFFFWPGEKSPVNRMYRRLSDRLLARRCRVTDYFFALSQCLGPARFTQVMSLARLHTVELMTHPAHPTERQFLLGDRYGDALAAVARGSYVAL